MATPPAPAARRPCPHSPWEDLCPLHLVDPCPHSPWQHPAAPRLPHLAAPCLLHPAAPCPHSPWAAPCPQLPAAPCPHDLGFPHSLSSPGCHLVPAWAARLDQA